MINQKLIRGLKRLAWFDAPKYFCPNLHILTPYLVKNVTLEAMLIYKIKDISNNRKVHEINVVHKHKANDFIKFVEVLKLIVR